MELAFYAENMYELKRNYLLKTSFNIEILFKGLKS